MPCDYVFERGNADHGHDSAGDAMSGAIRDQDKQLRALSDAEIEVSGHDIARDKYDEGVGKESLHLVRSGIEVSLDFLGIFKAVEEVSVDFLELFTLCGDVFALFLVLFLLGLERGE